MSDEIELEATVPPDGFEPPSGSDTESDANEPAEPGDGAENDSDAPPAEASVPAEASAPAEDQAPVATENDRVIVGDSGMYEQQPLNPVQATVDQPFRQSPPPAAMQSGVPLPEDRAAGVTTGH